VFVVKRVIIAVFSIRNNLAVCHCRRDPIRTSAWPASEPSPKEILLAQFMADWAFLAGLRKQR